MIPLIGQMLLRRAAATVPVLATASVLLFLAFAAAPGDPVSALTGDRGAGLSGQAQPSWGAIGDDAPLIRRIAVFIDAAGRGEFAYSYRFDGEKVVDIVRDRAPTTLMLAAAALALAVPLGGGLGLAAAMAVGPGGRAITVLLTACHSVPAAALAAGIIYVLAVSWRLLPVAGWTDGWSAVIPVIVLAVPAAGHIGRMTGALAGEVLPSAYVRTARAKGLSRRRIAWSHVLRNIAGPSAAFIGTIFSGLLGGTLLVETLFAIPGLGREAVSATLARDFPVALGCMLALIVFNTVIGAVADLIGFTLDPRVAEQEKRT